MAVSSGPVGGVLLWIGAVTFWASWALMPMPGTTDPAFILDAVAAARAEVLASCVLQLISAAAWAAGLIVAPGDRRAWTIGAALLAVGMTASAADAIYHLVAYELTAPGVAREVALPVIARFQTADLVLLLPGIASFFLGTAVFAVAGVRRGLLPRAVLATITLVAIAAATIHALVSSRVAVLVVLAGVVAPTLWIATGLIVRNPRKITSG